MYFWTSISPFSWPISAFLDAKMTPSGQKVDPIYLEMVLTQNEFLSKKSLMGTWSRLDTTCESAEASWRRRVERATVGYRRHRLVVWYADPLSRSHGATPKPNRRPGRGTGCTGSGTARPGVPTDGPAPSRSSHPQETLTFSWGGGVVAAWPLRGSRPARKTLRRRRLKTSAVTNRERRVWNITENKYMARPRAERVWLLTESRVVVLASSSRG